MNGTTDIQTTSAAGASESERQLGAVNGYPSLRSDTTGVPIEVEREGSGRSSNAERQRRWLEKLKASPDRLAEYRAKTRAASSRRYHESVKLDAEKLAAKRKASRESAARKRRGLGRPVKQRQSEETLRAKRREYRRKFREAHREEIRAYQRDYRQRRPEVVNACEKRQYPKRQARKKRAYHANPEPTKRRVARWQGRNRDRVRDYGVKRNLRRTIGEVPAEFLALYRAHLNLKRELREQKP